MEDTIRKITYDEHFAVKERDINHLASKLVKEEKNFKEAIENNRMNIDFFSNASHEFKTPLNVILGAIQLMEHNYEKGNTTDLNLGEQNKMLKIMKQNCNRLLRLINNIIDMARIDSGYMNIKMYNRNIVYLVEDLVMSVSEYIKDSGIKIIFDTEVEEKIIACNPDGIEKIVLNLLSNAIKFTNLNGDIFVHIYDGDEYLTITVRDSGVGIPDGELENIFDKFTCLDKSLSRNTEGTGIGLYLVKFLVESHGGSVRASSKEGVGSEFIVMLPIKTVEKNMEDDYADYTRQSKTEKISIEFSDIYTIY